MTDAAIVVFGATGVVGRRICAELSRAAVPFEVAGRSREALEGLGASHVHLADAVRPESLAAAFSGARVVINAAGPLRTTAEPVLAAAVTAGAHYVDVGGEQAALHELHERHESSVRRAGLVAAPGAGLDCMLGDLASHWAAAALCADPRERSVDHDAAAVRPAPIDRLAEDRPLEDVCVSYLFDDFALSAGSQRALFLAIGERPLVWRRDRWEPGRPGERRRVNAGPELGGERDAIAYAGGEPITVPRHLAATHVASYVSTTRRPGASRALGLLARALPHVPRAAHELLAPYPAEPSEYERTRFAVVAEVRRGFSMARVVIRGRDLYRATAVCTTWTARALASRSVGPTGMRAASELFAPAPTLRELATLADLAVEPSFG